MGIETTVANIISVLAKDYPALLEIVSSAKADIEGVTDHVTSIVEEVKTDIVDIHKAIYLVETALTELKANLVFFIIFFYFFY